MAKVRVPKTLRRLVTLLLVALIVEYLVIPQVAGARKSLHLIAHANLWLALLGVALEAASLLAYSQLTLSLLPRHSVSLGRVLRINLATLSVSHVVPGGTAAGGTLGYRLLTASGVAGPDTAFALALQGIGSAVVLNSVLWVALIVSIPIYGFNALYGTAAVLGVLLIGFVTAIAVFMTRGEERAVRILRAAAGRVPILQADRVEALFRRLAVRLQELTVDRAQLWRCVGWAAANWLLDAASLWIFLRAYGGTTPIDGLIIAFGLANVLAAVPITPGGVGIVEGVMIPTLVGFGLSKNVATLGVVSYRAASYWLPILLGGISYFSLRIGPWSIENRDQVKRLREVAKEEREDDTSGIEWAERYGSRGAATGEVAVPADGSAHVATVAPPAPPTASSPGGNGDAGGGEGVEPPEPPVGSAP